MLLSLTWNNPIAVIISIFIVLFLVLDVVFGFKRGFLENSIRFLRVFLAMLIAHLFKGGLSAYLFTNLPYFNLNGLFKGVSAVNILIYEVIAFFLLFVLVFVILNIICNIIKLEERVLRFVSIIGVPNKIMGAIIAAFKNILVSYFVLSIFFVVAALNEWNTGKSLGNYIIDIPVLKNSLGSTLEAFSDISDLAVSYKGIQDKEVLNNKVIDILLDYDILSKKELNVLIEKDKIEYYGN